MFVIGVGKYLPAAVVVADAGTTWERRCVALADDHPGNMASRAVAGALDDAAVTPQELDLVVYTGRARDYLPSWSVATEVTRELGATSRCVGIDMNMGCASLPAALELARAWLTVPGRRYAAIVDVELCSASIDRVSPESQRLWAYGDGAGAIIVASDPKGVALEILGSAFRTHAGYNAMLMPPYGGTRAPHAPDAASQLALRLDGTGAVDVFGVYMGLYEAALAELVQHHPGIAPMHVVCTQLSPAWVTKIVPRFHKPRPKTVVNTGVAAGHIGGVDLFLGLEALRLTASASGDVVIAGTAPYVTSLALARFR
ncbi:hypothetical protein BH11MYX2_BH11MYX2_20720 [soil metagenome]